MECMWQAGEKASPDTSYRLSYWLVREDSFLAPKQVGNFETAQWKMIYIMLRQKIHLGESGDKGDTF